MTRHPPPLTSLQDLDSIIQDRDPVTNKLNYITFYLITPDEEVFFGKSLKGNQTTLEEFSSALEHVKDEEIFPEIPENTTLTVAPDSLDDDSAFIKRPGLIRYDVWKGTDTIPR
jgi:hypothetical protein